MRGASVMHLAVDGKLAGLLVVADPVKSTTPSALQSLREAGLRVVMATGDGHTTAKAVAQHLGIDEVHGAHDRGARQSLSSASVITNALRLRKERG